jgi:hypothetical protein
VVVESCGQLRLDDDVKPLAAGRDFGVGVEPFNPFRRVRLDSLLAFNVIKAMVKVRAAIGVIWREHEAYAIISAAPVGLGRALERGPSFRVG